MQRYLGVLVIGAMGGFACATTFSQKLAAGQSCVQSLPAVTVAVEDLPSEHVRHMRVHNKPAEIEETPKESQALAAAEQAKPIIDEKPTGSIRPTKPRKARLASNKTKKIAGEQEVVSEQAPPPEIESPVPRGFFETIFQGN